MVFLGGGAALRGGGYVRLDCKGEHGLHLLRDCGGILGCPLWWHPLISAHEIRIFKGCLSATESPIVRGE